MWCGTACTCTCTCMEMGAETFFTPVQHRQLSQHVRFRTDLTGDRSHHGYMYLLPYMYSWKKLHSGLAIRKREGLVIKQIGRQRNRSERMRWLSLSPYPN